MRRFCRVSPRLFQVVFIEELMKKVIAVLENLPGLWKKNLRMPITKEALQLSYRLLLRYYPYEKFSRKGIKFLASV